MSEVYVISGGEIPPDAGGLPGWLEQQRIKASWLDEIHWLGIDSVPGIVFDGRQITWPVTGPAAHRLLHLILGEMLLGKREMSLLVQSAGSRLYGLLLGSPAALGRRNRLPLARLTALTPARSGVPSSLAALIGAELENNEVELPAMRGMYTSAALPEPDAQEFTRLFPGIEPKITENFTHGLSLLSGKDLVSGQWGFFLETIIRTATLVEKL